MPRQRSTLRAGALIAASALALHQLRYLIATPPAGGEGHGRHLAGRAPPASS